MNECPDFDHLLIVPHLRVQNANAISSPLTHGFPSMTAFLGLMWALERRTKAEGMDLRFKAVGVVCHHYQEQVADGFVKTFCLTRNPVKQDGNTAAIVEEGRIHLEISLLFAIQSDMLTQSLGATEKQSEMARQVLCTLAQMRIAGGSPMISDSPRHRPYVIAFTGKKEARQEQFTRLKYCLLPGFALVLRDDLLSARHAALQAANPAATRLDAWLSLARIDWRAEKEKNGEVKWQYQYERKGKGWIVPIPVGYGVLDKGSPHAPGSVANARDTTTPFCFVEGLYSVGEWRSPHRLQSPRDLLWYPEYEASQGLYRCRNDYRMLADDENDDFDFE